MSSIALVGGDGAGKSIVGRMLLDARVLPLEYLYMGINLDSSNLMLSTSRLLPHFRRQRTPPPTRRAATPSCSSAASIPASSAWMRPGRSTSSNGMLSAHIEHFWKGPRPSRARHDPQQH